MSKFKVGDRVRVVAEESDRFCRPFVSTGSVGTVDEVNDHVEVIVTLDDPHAADDGFVFSPDGWGYGSHELELIND